MLKSETNDDSKVRRERIRRETDARHDCGERLVRMRELTTLVGIGPSTIYRLIQQGRFPRPCHPLGDSNISAWRYSEVAQWIADRCAGRPA